MNDGPLCKCSAKARRTGIRHSIYPGEEVRQGLNKSHRLNLAWWGGGQGRCPALLKRVHAMLDARPLLSLQLMPLNATARPPPLRMQVTTVLC